MSGQLRTATARDVDYGDKVWWCDIGLHRQTCFNIHYPYYSKETPTPAEGHDACGWIRRPTATSKRRQP